MLAEFFTPGVLVMTAGTLQILSFLLINQVLLRLLMLVASILYVLYYFTVGPAPLWQPITFTSLTIVAILIGLAGLYARNAKWSIPAAHKDIYPLFDTLLPGDFRLLVQQAQRFAFDEDRTVTTEGERPDMVYFVISGTFQVSKRGHTFDVPGPTFVGEVAYLMDRPSAATTHMPAGVEVLEWRLDDLARLAQKQPRFKLALDAVISRDLANKVTLAVAPTL